MPSIFEEHRRIVDSKTGEYQEALTARIRKFNQDLQLYSSQSEEMQYWGNVEEIFRYKDKADRLEARLIRAMEIIDEFNQEEQMFGWEISLYPLRKQVDLHLSFQNQYIILVYVFKYIFVERFIKLIHLTNETFIEQSAFRENKSKASIRMCTPWVILKTLHHPYPSIKI